MDGRGCGGRWGGGVVWCDICRVGVDGNEIWLFLAGDKESEEGGAAA